jgi:hypothetical protein
MRVEGQGIQVGDHNAQVNDYRTVAAGRDVYAAGRDVNVTTGDVHLHFYGGEEDDPPPRQIDFSGYLDHKRKDFIGRSWLFDAVSSSGQKQDERALLMIGDPGLGKSAFLAELLHRSASSELLAFYFCMAEDRATLEPAAFVRHLTAMLASRLPSYAQFSDAPQYRRLLRHNAIGRDPANSLDQGVIALLRQLPASRQRLIIIDGLDEAQLVDPRENILTLLSSRLERFPPWISFILAARPDPQVLARLGEVRTLPIQAEDTRNLDDVRKLITQWLTKSGWRARLAAAGTREDTVVRRLAAAAQGNMLYAAMMLRSVELGRWDLGDLDGLPPGLAGIYQLFLERLFPEPASFEQVRPLMESTVAALAPLPDGILKSTSGLHANDLRAALSLLATLIPGQRDHYAFYHRSLADWLTQPYHPFHIDLASGRARLSRGFIDHLRQPGHNFTFAPPTEPVAEYWATYGLNHLALSADHVPPDLPPDALAPIIAAQDHISVLGQWTKQGLPPGMRRYVHDLLSSRQFDDIVSLLNLLKQVTMYYYARDGLVRERVEPDGHIVYEITNKATDGHKIITALKVSGYAGAIFRAVKDSPQLALTTDQMTTLVDQLRTVRYMAGGIGTAYWADDIKGEPGFLTDAGYFLNRELHELTNGY